MSADSHWPLLTTQNHHHGASWAGAAPGRIAATGQAELDTARVDDFQDVRLKEMYGSTWRQGRIVGLHGKGGLKKQVEHFERMQGGERVYVVRNKGENH